MPDSLLWINKDSDSSILSRSSKAETRQIRKHVQHERQLRAKAEAAAKHAAAGDKSPRKSQPRCRSLSEQRTARSTPSGNSRLPCSPAPVSRSRSLVLPHSATKSPVVTSGRLLQAVSSFPGLEPQEHRSLVFFCQRTAPEWSGWRDAAFWNKLILQACHLNRSILHGIIALGALHETQEMETDSVEHTQLHDLALGQSSKASRMACETAMPEVTTLISCVIFICLQNLQDSHAAYQLLKSGYSLITNIDERLGSGDLYLADSEAAVLDNFIRPIIERLRMRFCSIVDVPSALALNAAMKREGVSVSSMIPHLPECFETLLEARNSLEGIIEWAQENIDPLDQYCEQRAQVQTLLGHWDTALQDTTVVKLEMYQTLHTSKKLLRAAALVSSILFATLGTSEECAYDEHTSKFAEIIGLYQTAIGELPRNCRTTSFGIDSGVIDTLAFVAGRCRHPILRRTAIHLLSQTNRNEGDLQGCTGSTIMTTLMDIEEEGLTVTDPSDVPESSRVRIWEDHQYWETGEIRIFFVKRPYDPALGAEIRTASVHLPLKFSRAAKEKAAPDRPTGMPNVRYGRGFGGFLEEGAQIYHNITLSSFFMPMPRL